MRPEDAVDHRKMRPFCYRNEDGCHVSYYLEPEEDPQQVDTEKLKEQGFYIYEYRKNSK